MQPFHSIDDHNHKSPLDPEFCKIATRSDLDEWKNKTQKKFRFAK